jgi:hypothetical protein
MMHIPSTYGVGMSLKWTMHGTQLLAYNIWIARLFQRLRCSRNATEKRRMFRSCASDPANPGIWFTPSKPGSLTKVRTGRCGWLPGLHDPGPLSGSGNEDEDEVLWWQLRTAQLLVAGPLPPPGSVATARIIGNATVRLSQADRQRLAEGGLRLSRSRQVPVGPHHRRLWRGSPRPRAIL